MEVQVTSTLRRKTAKEAKDKEDYEQENNPKKAISLKPKGEGISGIKETSTESKAAHGSTD